MADFSRVSQSVIYQGRVFALMQEEYQSPTGELFDRQIVRHNGAVAVVPLHDDGTVTLIRQYRPALDSRILEIPAGLLDKPGESRIDAAARELREETGFVAESLLWVCDLTPAPGLADERISVYVATGLQFEGVEADGPEEVDITFERVPLSDVVGMISRGEIVDGKTVAGLLMVAASRTSPNLP